MCSNVDRPQVTKTKKRQKKVKEGKGCACPHLVIRDIPGVRDEPAELPGEGVVANAGRPESHACQVDTLASSTCRHCKVDSCELAQRPAQAVPCSTTGAALKTAMTSVKGGRLCLRIADDEL